MNAVQSSPELVYQEIRNIINSIMAMLNQESIDTHTQETTTLGIEILSKLHAQIDKQLAILEKNAEWDTFTIAFYGETNAGKSTIIETLRILLNESTKVEQQASFKLWQLETGITQEAFDSLRQSLLEAEKEIKELPALIEKERSLLETTLQTLESSDKQQTDVVEKTKSEASLWNRLVWLFIDMPGSAELKVIQDSIKKQVTVISCHHKQAQQKQQVLEDFINTQRSTHDEMQKQVEKADHLADGSIIGNGKSDFTLDSQAYYFSKGGHKFALLDVPGIEGKETKVSDAIWQAVHKAHAVFYVTGKAAAPQKGDDDNPGTLDKIKKHLGDQTEVYTLYNKRVTNPIQLEKSDLLNEGEKESLLVLDSKMFEYLKESYQKTISISAYPAFLGASTCLLPGSSNQRNQRKFLNKFSSAELQVKTQTSALIDMFTLESVSEFKDKIIRSNKNKAKQVVSHALNEVNELQSKKFTPLLEQLKSDLLSTEIELDSAAEALQRRLRAKAKDKIDCFKRTVRRETYADIDEEISNERFKRCLKTNIKNGQEKLKEELPIVLEKEMAVFEEQIIDIIERYQVQTSELIGLYNNMNNAKADFNFDLDNGIKIGGIIGAVVGGIALWWNPVGWALIAVSVATLAFSVYKSVRSFFSNKYKMSQQRNSTDENMDNIVDSINENLEESLSSSIEQVGSKISEIKTAMQQSVNQVESVNNKISSAENALKKLSNQLGE